MKANLVEVEIGAVASTCFIAMPFTPLFTSEYEHVIKPAVEAVGLACVRVDEIYSKRGIVADVWKSIRQCRLVIAELSGRNPNVLYEVGLAHAIGKPVILLTRREGDVPFDLKSLRYLFYETKDPFWGRALTNEIVKMIAGVLEDSTGATHLDGIHTTAIQAIKSSSGVASEGEGYSGPLDNTSWVGVWGAYDNRHRGTLLIRQQNSTLSAALAVTTSTASL